MDLDTFKSAIIGGGSITIQFMEMLPEIVRLGVGVATIVYFIYKIQLIRKQLKER
jgi:hypothetical protein